jgi:hypothetical protein
MGPHLGSQPTTHQTTNVVAKYNTSNNNINTHFYYDFYTTCTRSSRSSLDISIHVSTKSLYTTTTIVVISTIGIEKVVPGAAV